MKSLQCFLFKAFLAPRIIFGLILYVGALILWLFALRKVDVSYAYPFTALGFIFVLILSVVWLNESMNIYRLLGISLIIGGVLVLSLKG